MPKCDYSACLSLSVSVLMISTRVGWMHWMPFVPNSLLTVDLKSGSKININCAYARY